METKYCPLRAQAATTKAIALLGQVGRLTVEKNETNCIEDRCALYNYPLSRCGLINNYVHTI